MPPPPDYHPQVASLAAEQTLMAKRLSNIEASINMLTNAQRTAGQGQQAQQGGRKGRNRGKAKNKGKGGGFAQGPGSNQGGPSQT
jgi:hypothetical protein